MSSPEPAGTGSHVVQPGECFHSLAMEAGHFYKAMWEHPDNAALRDARESPFLLLPGDRVEIPELTPKYESRATGARHTFKRKGVPAMLRLRVADLTPREESAPQEQPAPDEDAVEVEVSEQDEVELDVEVKTARDIQYRLDVDGVLTKTGKVGSDGMIETEISPAAREAALTLEPATPRERRIVIRLGGTDPRDSDSGVLQRLGNLGYVQSDEVTLDHPMAVDAIRSFQAGRGLEATGRLDDATRDALREAHGS